MWIVVVIAVLVFVPPLREWAWTHATPVGVALLVLAAIGAVLNRTGRTVGSLLGMPARDRRCGTCRGTGRAKYPVQTGWNPKVSIPIYSYRRETCRTCNGSGSVHY